MGVEGEGEAASSWGKQVSFLVLRTANLVSCHCLFHLIIQTYQEAIQAIITNQECLHALLKNAVTAPRTF